MKVNTEPTLADVNFEVMSVVPVKSVAVVASEPIVTAMVPAAVPAATVGAAAGGTLSKLYVSAVDAAERLPAASPAFAVTAVALYSTCPATGVKVTTEPTLADVNFEVMSVVPANNFAVVASDPMVTAIAPAAPAAAVGAAAGGMLSNV